MSGGIYLIQEDDRLVEMIEKPYDSEALLQELLEKYPHLLAVDRVSNGYQRRWLMVKRIAGATSEEPGMGQWALDRIFLDRQAIPTLVDVRRNQDTQMRRDAIGQMLDYAANIGIYWPVESILAQFEANCRSANRDPEQVFEDFLGANANEEEFWQQVKTNLQAGKIRLIFAADRISPELQRVVEFLNKQTDPAEVLAVEIKQYASGEEDLKTLVSKTIGQTAEAQQKKTSTARERRQWDKNSFIFEYQARYGDDEAAIVQQLYQWASERSPAIQIYWGTGDTYGGFAAKFHASEEVAELFFVGIDGTLQIVSDIYANLAPFDREDEWHQLRNQLSSIGLALPANSLERRLPNFQLSTLSDESAVEQVLKTFDWVVQKIKQAHHL
ncbi:hypothetical protein [Lusitaniella coriacea]|uniref:hypothetical protein n=1 Tax=Lusitaniella coriacea TaxID=1983105 RepID=UPI003CF51D5F